MSLPEFWMTVKNFKKMEARSLWAYWLHLQDPIYATLSANTCSYREQMSIKTNVERNRPVAIWETKVRIQE
jgi:hypothetical protein